MVVLRQWGSGFLEEAREWCRGKFWPLRLLLWLWMAWVFVQSLRDPQYQPLIAGLNLGIHELGHIVFAPFGEFVQIAGGSLLQCLVPFGSVFMFWRQRDFFAIGWAFWWLGTNQFSVAAYIADARAMELPLVSPFGSDNVIHDWNYLLGHLNLLDADTTIAFGVRCLATLSMLLGLGWGGWLLGRMVWEKGMGEDSADDYRA